MLTVIETPIFQRMVADVLNDADRQLLIQWIAGNPLAGDVIPGADGLRKVRWGRAGMGKRGGGRVIYFTRLAHGEVVLVAIYAKAKFDNMPAAVLKMWKDAYDA
ncbi:transcriptional regulator [Giesbergeria anulus]|nr:transcriptional regulator [Giesbergeria anulus]